MSILTNIVKNTFETIFTNLVTELLGKEILAESLKNCTSEEDLAGKKRAFFRRLLSVLNIPIKASCFILI